MNEREGLKQCKHARLSTHFRNVNVLFCISASAMIAVSSASMSSLQRLAYKSVQVENERNEEENAHERDVYLFPS
jgi:hypothetical protein